ncbi:MAG: signal peptidase I [Nitrosarchaeum sp.]|nr:signal peptidase I [Nitrosarchaeum sp.]MBP0119870.1 signal peptidase I [Nitrosarchaeum sp.]MBP0133550.1 signal peptidase I [Nitrosarchaeum sp.]
MNKKSMSKGIIKDILIVAIGVLAIWIGLQVAFGTQNPFYVVASGSMIPVLQVYDVLIVQGHEPFEDIKVGDVIVFNRPSGQDRVIVHRVASIINDDPKIIRTQGDANPASIPGTDFPITKEEYIGKVAYVIPQIGYVTQILKPPMNYIIIVIVVGIMIVKQISKKKNDKGLNINDLFTKNNSEQTENHFSELDTLEKDKEYSTHVESKPLDEDNSKNNSDKEQK